MRHPFVSVIFGVLGPCFPISNLFMMSIEICNQAITILQEGTWETLKIAKLSLFHKATRTQVVEQQNAFTQWSFSSNF